MKVVIFLVLVAFAIAVAAKSSERKDLYEWVRHPSKWSRVGRSDPNRIHKFVIALHPKPEGAAKLFKAYNEIVNPEHPRYRQFLSHDEVHDMLNPGMKVKAPVLKWLRSEKRVKIVSMRNNFISVEAPIKSIERLFQTEMHDFANPHTGKTIPRHTGKTSLPAEVHPHVHLIEGLHEFPPLKPHAASHKVAPPAVVSAVADAVGNNTPTYYSVNFPLSWWSMYNISNGSNIVTNKGASQGMFAQLAADGIPLVSDLKQWCLLNNIPVQTYTYNGENDTMLGGEASLDMQMMTSVAINAPTTFFMQINWIYMFVTDLISMGSQAPLVVSISYGWNEDQECSDVLHDVKVCSSHGWNSSQYVNASDLQMAAFGATGHTLLSSSGDQGAPGDQNVDCSLDNKLALYPMYPTSSPYVCSVGATAVAGTEVGNIGPVPKRGSVALPCTTKLLNCTKGPVAEVGCYTDVCAFTTGGGFSQLDAQPSWQTPFVQGYLKSGVVFPPTSKFNSANRAYPDVSALGQNTLTIQNGNWFITGGTSASSPLMAGVVTLFNNLLLNAGKAPVGPAAPLLYRMATSCPQCFNKVTFGTNYCTEESCCRFGYGVPSNGGYNTVTGLGTPNVGNMLEWIKQNL